ncbi:MAG: hypothetical protein U9N12_08770, partial [Euryarchaeota archaeon]|nr:hypothetical protein [Euryarchaeota archaeon]
AGEMFAKPYVRTDCAEFKPVEMRRWAPREAGSPVTCSGEEVTSCDPPRIRGRSDPRTPYNGKHLR